MNKIEQFENLVALARHERAPAIYVVAPVLDEIRARSYVSLTPTRPLAIFTGLSLSAAALVVMLALPAWESEFNPLAAMFEPLARMLQ
jgi:hypothetical protein